MTRSWENSRVRVPLFVCVPRVQSALERNEYMIVASHAYRRGLLAVATAGALFALVNEASAVSAKVRFACAGDYLANCSSFVPDSPETRRCMRAVGFRLSKGCVAALVQGGEVSKTEVARKAAR